MRNFIILSGIILYSAFAHAQSFFINNDAKVVVSNATYLTIQGSLENKQSGSFKNDGEITLTGNWINTATNNVFETYSGSVVLNGADQYIQGTNSTYFYNLTLDGSGTKFLNIASSVFGILNLNSFEFNTLGNILSVQNSLQNAIQLSTGFVSSTGAGKLVRNMEPEKNYLFPVGSSLNTLRYRPAFINLFNSGNAEVGVRLVNNNPDLDSYDRSVTDGSVGNLLDNYYYKIAPVASIDSLSLAFSYSNADDGSMTGIAHWDESPDQWEQTKAASNGVFNTQLDTIHIDAWSDFSSENFDLFGCIPSTAPAGIDASAAIICKGSSTTLTVNGGSLGTGATWQWYTGSCGGASVGSGTSITPMPSATTTYYVRAEGTCGITSCAEITIQVDEDIPVLTINTPSAVCAPTAIDLTDAAVTLGSTNVGSLS